MFPQPISFYPRRYCETLKKQQEQEQEQEQDWMRHSNYVVVFCMKFVPVRHVAGGNVSNRIICSNFSNFSFQYLQQICGEFARALEGTSSTQHDYPSP
jgi:hypothetical protein